MPLGRRAQNTPGTDVTPARQPQPPAPATPPAAPTTDLVLPDHILAAIDQAVTVIPEDDGDGGAGILEQLLAAETIDQINAPWNGSSGRDLNGKRLKILSLTRRPSDFDGGVEIFLVVKAIDVATGEPVTFTTSSMAVITQLAVAWNRGWLPLTADITAAVKPTKRGFLPYHLNIVSIRDAS